MVDTSTNGTGLNGVRLQRAVPVPLADGDRIQLGSTELRFGIDYAAPVRPADQTARSTVAASTFGLRALVVGDVAGYTTIAQTAMGYDLVEAINTLFGDLRVLLHTQYGTLADVPGDAIFAYWDPEPGGVSISHAVEFALLADRRVRHLAPSLALRNPDGSPLADGLGRRGRGGGR